MNLLSKAAAAALVASSTLVATSVSADPAPPLTYLEVVAVCSADDYAIYGDCEGIADAQTTTYGNHGGAWMYAVTAELGYGTSKYATLGGTQVYEIPGSAQAITQNVNGQNVIIGWYRYWNLTGASGGTFYYQSQSINSPFNLESDSVSIL